MARPFAGEGGPEKPLLQGGEIRSLADFDAPIDEATAWQDGLEVLQPSDDILYLLGETGTMPILQEAAEVDRSKEIFRLSRNPETYEVGVESEIRLADYEKITPAQDMALLKDWAKTMEGKSVAFINPTYEGGGVAMLRGPVVHLMRELGVGAHWYVMQGKENPNDPLEPDPFTFTKQMHNISQRMVDERINEEGKSLHREWNDRNAEVLLQQETLRTADVIVIDDPQPAPLIRPFKEVNPGVKIVWRNHIDTNGALMADPTTPQGEVASYLLNECGVRDADAAITHPVEAFVHPEMSANTYFAPATIEPYDDLNRRLNEAEIEAGIVFINSEIAKKNQELAAQGRYEDTQSELDPNRKKLTLVARFDESKGMDKAMGLGVQTRQKMLEDGTPESELPQIVIVGNGSVDDPSGVPMYEKMLQLRREKYADSKDSITLMRLTHNYQAMNALMYKSDIGLQTSDAEGCETRISDWIRHGVPMLVSNRGGMSLQVVEGQSGFVLDFDQPDFDLNRGAEIAKHLLSDSEAYHAMSQKTAELSEAFNEREFTTTANTTRLLRIFNNVMTDTPADRQWLVSQMARPER